MNSRGCSEFQMCSQQYPQRNGDEHWRRGRNRVAMGKLVDHAAAPSFTSVLSLLLYDRLAGDRLPVRAAFKQLVHLFLFEDAGLCVASSPNTAQKMDNMIS